MICARPSDSVPNRMTARRPMRAWADLLAQAMQRESAARAAGDQAGADRHAQIRVALLDGAQRARARAALVRAGHGALLLDSLPAVIDDLARALGEQGGGLAGALVVLADELGAVDLEGRAA